MGRKRSLNIRTKCLCLIGMPEGKQSSKAFCGDWERMSLTALQKPFWDRVFKHTNWNSLSDWFESYWLALNVPHSVYQHFYSHSCLIFFLFVFFLFCFVSTLRWSYVQPSLHTGVRDGMIKHAKGLSSPTHPPPPRPAESSFFFLPSGMPCLRQSRLQLWCCKRAQLWLCFCVRCAKSPLEITGFYIGTVHLLEIIGLANAALNLFI